MNWLGKYNFFYNYGSGAPLDPENARRESTAIANYQKFMASTGQPDFKTNVSPSELNFEMAFFPIMGLATGLITSRMFVSPHSFYIGKIWTAGLVWIGYNMARARKDLYNCHYFAGNFERFP
jgi:hypothetical protein